MSFAILKDHLALRESYLIKLQTDVCNKKAYLAGLPRVEICDLAVDNTKPVRFVRLADPKAEGLSLKKRQCDLWEFTWGSSVLLSFIMKHMTSCDNKSTLELGGGIGLSTLTTCHFWRTSRSVMTDLVPDALSVFELSVELQKAKLQTVPTSRLLNWNRPAYVEGETFDIVMGSDVLFMNWCAKPVAEIASRVLSADGVILVVDPYRMNDGAFFGRLNELGIREQRAFDFPSGVLTATVQPVLDHKGSVVPVARAKLLVASRCSLEDLGAKLIRIGMIPL